MAFVESMGSGLKVQKKKRKEKKSNKEFYDKKEKHRSGCHHKLML